MNTGDLLQRMLDHLGEGAEVFWTPQTMVTEGLNVAQRLLALCKPTLLTQRVAVPLVADQVFLDLREVGIAPRCLKVERVSIGDGTTMPATPVVTVVAGNTVTLVGDLRKTTLATLRSHHDWFHTRALAPSCWYPHGMQTVCTWPRATIDLTATLVYSTIPTPLVLEAPTQVPDFPAQWHPLLADLGAELVRGLEGSGVCEEAVQNLAKLIGDEPLLTPLLKAVRAQQYRQQAQQGKASA